MERISYEKAKATISPDNAMTAFGWCDMNVEVKRYLDLGDMMTFVDAVFQSCFGDDGEYHPEAKDFAIRSCIMEIYANFEMPEDISERYDLVYRCGAIPEIMKYIDQAQFNAMMRAVDERIEAKLEAMNSANEQTANKLFESIEVLVETLGRTFDGVDSETLAKLAEALSGMDVDEEKLVRAVTAVMAEKETEESSANTVTVLKR